MLVPEIPNNSLKSEIEQITKLALALEGEEWFEFNNPATEIEIKELENYFNAKFPESYKDWLRFSNGSSIANNYIVFFTISQVKKLQIKTLPDDYIIIGKLIGDGELLCISKASQSFIRYFESEEHKYNDLKEFFERPLKRMIRNAEEILGDL